MISHPFRRLAAALVLVSAIHCPAAGGLSDTETKAIRDGFTDRREAAINSLDLDRFKPRKIDPPLGPNRPAFSRTYGYSVASFALTAFWRGQRVEEANAALRELINYFKASREARNDNDNFYWWTPQLVRAIDFFGSSGSRVKGRMSAEVEAAALEMMWLWTKENSLLSETVISPDYWYVRGSENHHVQGFSACWDFARLLLRRAEYQQRRCDDGHTVAEHYAAWTRYAGDYMAMRAKQGLFIEAATEYNVETMKGIHQFYDFAEDPELKRRAGMLITLFWAAWAQEQIDGVRGGGKTRNYPGRWSTSGQDSTRRLGWFYLGLGSPVKLLQADELVFLTSEYRLPDLVIDLALDARGRGVYEAKQYPLGLAVPGYHKPPGYRLRNDAGGILRYSYCTPDFILGTLMFESHSNQDWAMISSQNRWQGVIFAGDLNARIFPVPQPVAKAQERAYNTWWSVQAKGALITQSLPGQNAGPMRIWFSRSGLEQRTESCGWVFVKAPAAFAAVRVAEGQTTWESITAKPGVDAGDWLVCSSSSSPVILEVSRQQDFSDFAAFKAHILATPCGYERKKLEYTSLAGDHLTFFADRREPPRINGQRIAVAPPQFSLKSPFISADWNSGKVILQKGARRLTLDFNRATRS
ncbi:MAG: hypothetical protein WCH99_16430 [Verrucomicrobiota bacterium]